MNEFLLLSVLKAMICSRQQQSVDMFPQTDESLDIFPHTSDIHNGVSGHVETCVLLSQQHIDDYIRVSVDLEPEDVTPAETAATYDMIKQYVLQHFGVKVSVLYIAQTKRKYGLDMRENYNKSKKPDAKVPTCPPEKEKMMLDGMLPPLKKFDRAVKANRNMVITPFSYP